MKEQNNAVRPCNTCVHEPICAYCSEHLAEFSLPDEKQSCDLYAGKNLVEGSCKEYNPFADTVEGMLSADYKERFKAEYAQTKIRYERLKAFNTRIEAACRTDCDVPGIKKVEMPQHDCPDSLLREQQARMGEYLHLLEVRAQIEKIEL